MESNDELLNKWLISSAASLPPSQTWPQSVWAWAWGPSEMAQEHSFTCLIITRNQTKNKQETTTTTTDEDNDDYDERWQRHKSKRANLFAKTKMPLITWPRSTDNREMERSFRLFQIRSDAKANKWDYQHLYVWAGTSSVVFLNNMEKQIKKNFN